jgi:hypothetical protein
VTTDSEKEETPLKKDVLYKKIQPPISYIFGNNHSKRGRLIRGIKKRSLFTECHHPQIYDLPFKQRLVPVLLEQENRRYQVYREWNCGLLL